MANSSDVKTMIILSYLRNLKLLEVETPLSKRNPGFQAIDLEMQPLHA